MVYFDNAATTYPKPECVLRAVESAVTEYGGNPGRGGHALAMRASEKIYSVRKKAAEFFHTAPEKVVFTQNCTMALNMAVKGALQAGEHVVLSCLEHNAVIRPVYRLSQEKGISYDAARVFPYDEARTVASFEKCIQKNTRAVICTHASNVSGLVMPIRALGELCRSYGVLFIVDAAQTAGVLPIDMERDHIDFLCMPGHKGLYGVTGSGMLLLREGMDEGTIGTLMEGGTGSLSSQLAQPDFSPDRFEAGTVNVPGILSIGAGLDFIRTMGMERIYRHEFSLCERVYRTLRKTPQAELYTPDFLYGKNAPIVAFNLKGRPSEELTEELSRRGFALRGGLHCSPLAHEYYGTLDTGMVRFAPSVFTSQMQVERFLRNISALA